MRLALVAPDGVGLRNFVLGSFAKRLRCECLVLHNCPEELEERFRADVEGRFEWRRLIPLPDRTIPFLLRQTLSFAHVYWADTHSMRYTRSRKLRGSWRTVAANRMAKMAGRAAASAAGIGALERAYFGSVARSAEVEAHLEILREFRPTVLLSTSQQSPNALAPVLAARKLGIPTIAFVASWDNLTSKGRIAAPYDFFLVWSEHMKSELLRFYPHVREERVRVAGTPQFDFYGDAGIRWTRAEFLGRIGAEATRPLICFSGGDEGTCPDDPHHLRILLEQVRSGEIRHRPQVVLRPSPVDDGRRYEGVRRDFPELLYAPPKWLRPQSGVWAQYVPLREDVTFLANLTRHCDLNVNTASTMTLDFGLHDRPVVNLAFDVTSPPPLRVPLAELFYTWDHYRPVVQLRAARLARSAGELAEHVNLYLEDPSVDRDGRRKLAEIQVGAPIGTSSDRILDFLGQVSHEPVVDRISV